MGSTSLQALCPDVLLYGTRGYTYWLGGPVNLLSGPVNLLSYTGKAIEGAQQHIWLISWRPKLDKTVN